MPSAKILLVVLVGVGCQNPEPAEVPFVFAPARQFDGNTYAVQVAYMGVHEVGVGEETVTVDGWAHSRDDGTFFEDSVDIPVYSEAIGEPAAYDGCEIDSWVDVDGTIVSSDVLYVEHTVYAQIVNECGIQFGEPDGIRTYWLPWEAFR